MHLAAESHSCSIAPTSVLGVTGQGGAKGRVERAKLGGIPLVVAAGIVAAACTPAVEQDETTRDESGEVIEGGEVGALSLKVGDCLAAEESGEVQSVPVVPCSEPHDSELFHSFDVTADEYPGLDQMGELAQSGCIEAFDDFIGFPYADSVWDVTSIYPTEDTWNELDDREVLCGVYPLSDEDTTGSARGVGE